MDREYNKYKTLTNNLKNKIEWLESRVIYLVLEKEREYPVDRIKFGKKFNSMLEKQEEKVLCIKDTKRYGLKFLLYNKPKLDEVINMEELGKLRIWSPLSKTHKEIVIHVYQKKLKKMKC